MSEEATWQVWLDHFGQPNLVRGGGPTLWTDEGFELWRDGLTLDEAQAVIAALLEVGHDAGEPAGGGG